MCNWGGGIFSRGPREVPVVKSVRITAATSIYIHGLTSNVYNMSGRVVSDIQTRAEGESLYIGYNTDANVVNNLKNDSSYKFISEVILKINVV